MSDLEILQGWLKKVAEIKEWPPAEEWGNHEYQELSEEISNKTGVLINRNTLRKLVSHLSGGQPYSPRLATRNAFAQYLDFENWKLFSQSLQKKNTKRKSSNLYWAAAIAILLTIGAILKSKSKDDPGKYEFIVSNPVGTAPHTVTCEYNMEHLKWNRVKLDLGHVDPTGKYLLVDVNKQAHIRKECFHYPGAYKVRLFINEKLQHVEDVWIHSEGWFAYIVDIKPYHTLVELPDWFKKKGVPILHHIPFDAIIEPRQTPDGFMYIPQNEIDAIEGLSSNYHTHLKNYQNFGVALNNCEFSIQFKDEDFEEGTHCQEVAFHLQGEKGKIGFKFAEEGCIRYTHQLIGNKLVGGKENELDFLNISYKELTSVSIKSTYHTIILLVNGNVRKTIEHSSDLGMLRGLHFWFKGTPQIDFVELRDSTSKVMYADYFDQVGE